MASNFVQGDLDPSRSVQIFEIYSNSPLPAAKKKKKTRPAYGWVERPCHVDSPQYHSLTAITSQRLGTSNETH